MKKPKAIVFSGYGLNCEEETAYAFRIAGGEADIVHINDLTNGNSKLNNYQILAIPGGFSYGDDTGSGRAYAGKIKNNLFEQIKKFIKKDKLVIGICNGFQVLTHLGLLPGALVHNTSARYVDRWVDLKVVSKSPWLKNIKTISLPIAHGEGNYFIQKNDFKDLKKNNQIALKYFKGEICKHQFLNANPNGSLENIAGVTDKSGKILGLMPHPERAIFFHHLPHWTFLKEKVKRAGKKISQKGPGLKIFQNAVEYFN